MSTDHFAEHDLADIATRLRKIEGQIRGIHKMVVDGRDCGEIVQQLAAARAALDRTGNVIVTAGLRGCLADTPLPKTTMAKLNTTLGALAALRS